MISNKDRAKKLARRVQRLFAQHIELAQPSYTWILSRVIEAGHGDIATVESVVFPKLLETWKAQP